ncbi:hypothetical protein [Amycolatopsis sp. DG1A-15b]|uniref:hypothetical protein n=1 Tax=Amycolatopsis sp. DG1A-15b TaxID=3052846 RepID=UPI00255C1F79|nr:hypothetical protein [Amycolatopsis sp. DG1A-15b]WIX91322.1 hypothetical protein QRY02_13070 [Amycolatopsis sp. DG1A-15b]
MLAWILGGYAVLFLLLLGCAGFVAVLVNDPDRRADAYKVLRLLTGIVLGSGGAGGLVGLLIKLHELGVI